MTIESAPMTDTETSDWVLVPREPTPEMLNAPLPDKAGVYAHPVFESRRDLRPTIYRTMLAAAPKPQGDDLEPVAWMHPTLNWVHDRREMVAPHCRKDGPQPVPLYPASALQSLKAERDEAFAQVDALSAKVEALAPHGMCGCSYDTPDDLCLHHSPKLVAAEAEKATLKREIAELREAARHIMPYLIFTIGDESPGYHPTMPSAVDAFKEAFASQGGK